MTASQLTVVQQADRPPVGALLRVWRQRRRCSQLELSCQAGVSARHLTFVETGRAQPSRQLLLQLADSLDVPLRARNQLLLAAGYAPIYPEHRLADEPMAPVREAIDLLLTGYEPHPAAVIDGPSPLRWTQGLNAARSVGSSSYGFDSPQFH